MISFMIEQSIKKSNYFFYKRNNCFLYSLKKKYSSYRGLPLEGKGNREAVDEVSSL